MPRSRDSRRRWPRGARRRGPRAAPACRAPRPERRDAMERAHDRRADAARAPGHRHHAVFKRSPASISTSQCCWLRDDARLIDIVKPGRYVREPIPGPSCPPALPHQRRPPPPARSPGAPRRRRPFSRGRTSSASACASADSAEQAVSTVAKIEAVDRGRPMGARRPARRLLHGGGEGRLRHLPDVVGGLRGLPRGEGRAQEEVEAELARLRKLLAFPDGGGLRSRAALARARCRGRARSPTTCGPS